MEQIDIKNKIKNIEKEVDKIFIQLETINLAILGAKLRENKHKEALLKIEEKLLQNRLDEIKEYLDNIEQNKINCHTNWEEI